MPDNPSVTPQILVVISGEAIATIQANVLRPLLREQGLHDTGVCGFIVDTKNCPTLAGGDDLEIFDADTNVRIYRRRPETADIDAKVFRLEGQLLRNAVLNEAMEPHFHMAFTRLDSVPEETAKSIIGIPFSPSIYVTGRVYYRAFEPLLRDRGFQTCISLRDPLEELAEQLLLLQWAATRPRSTLKGVLHEAYLDIVELMEPDVTSSSGQMEAWLLGLPPRARATLTDPMTRLLTCLSSEDRLAPQALADALDTLAECSAVGFRSDMRGFVAHIEAALDTEMPSLPGSTPSKRVVDLAGNLSRLEVVGQILSVDKELYDIARESFAATQ